MRIGVIGAGAAGLTTAWLLRDDHQVTLIEKQKRLGGHAHTIEVQQDGVTARAESGFEFFIEEVCPRFGRLLRALDAPLRRYPMTFSLYREDSGTIHLMPPKHGNGYHWPAFAPRSLAYMLQFEWFSRQAARLVEERDLRVSIGDFVQRVPLSRAFREDFLFPFMMGGWCIPPTDFQRMSAYDVLKFLVLHRPEGVAPREFSEIDGGTAAYVATLRGALGGARVLSGVEIRCIRRSGAAYVVADASGQCMEFDHLVFATNAPEASRMLTCVDEAAAQRAVLNSFRYFSTSIAIHGDRRVMPPNPSHWSVFNVRSSKQHSLTTVWRQQRTRLPLFKSWVAEGGPLPEPLYQLTRYEHPFVDAEHFRTQRSLAELQGRSNLWFAGAHTHDIDSHESAIESAVRVARLLAPKSRNLTRLA
ncbi:MAG TPA: FAD-dependent oxidoreductase [Bryobacteraceae bacterium]